VSLERKDAFPSEVPLAISSGTATLYLNFGGVVQVGHGLVDRDGVVSLDSGRQVLEFAPTLVEILNPWPDVQLVLTTDWIRTVGLERTKCLLPVPLRARVLDTILAYRPRLSELLDGSAKTRAILAHSRLHRVLAWLAIDDETFGVPVEYEQHFLRTDPDHALGCASAQARLTEWLMRHGT
jgi:HAD domain in Swiss Army Knife RNA repair proteins